MEFLLGLTYGCRGPKTGAIFGCFSRHMSRELDPKCPYLCMMPLRGVGLEDSTVNFFPSDLPYKHTCNLKITDLDWGYPVRQQVATGNYKDFSQLK